MKIGKNVPVDPVQKAADRVLTPPGGPKVRGYAAADAAAATGDRASIFGIPEQELTPKVRQAIMMLMAEVDRQRREIEQARKRLEELERDVNIDPLVPVFNRRAFVREMGRLMSFAARYQIGASLIYFDLNHFKEINDLHGHGAGDAALVHVGHLLTSNVRESDVVGRLGGDEFAILLASASEEVAQRKAESLAHLLATTPLNYDGKQIQLMAAFGVYTFKPGEDAATALAEADRAMFKHKKLKKEEKKQSKFKG